MVAQRAAAALDAGAYGVRRQQLLMSLQGSARDAMSVYSGDGNGGREEGAKERLVAATTSALMQVALLQAGAAGLTGLVAAKAASLADLTGLLPAALLAVTGLPPS